VPAGEGFIAAYHAVDRLIGTLTQAFPDATVVAFSAHGMGANDSDVPSMVLLAELLYRQSFGKPFMRERAAWTQAPDGVPLLSDREDVDKALLQALPGAFAARVSGAVSRRLTHALRSLGIAPAGALSRHAPGANCVSLDWMPAARYRRFWPRMKAFALPSFYDGRIRINLEGRERHGLVPLSGYDAACDEIEDLLHGCRNLRTGEPVVGGIERCGGRDPLTLGPTGADLIVAWRGAPLGFSHPQLGRIGPVPYRRTGGHTGDHGVAFISGRSIPMGDQGVRSTFDIVPTVIALLGEARMAPLSGKSLVEAAIEPA
jgi:predicted AlkP superfamily phosphohydrolase/phosphomutase